jgi:hypothetical protein
MKIVNRQFLFLSALISSFLLLDDLFLLHEDILPVYLHAPEIIYPIFYALLFLVYLALVWKTLFSTNVWLIIVALICLGLSVVVDIEWFYVPQQFLIEDGFKLIGAVSWLAFFSVTAIDMLNQSMEKRRNC